VWNSIFNINLSSLLVFHVTLLLDLLLLLLHDLVPIIIGRPRQERLIMYLGPCVCLGVSPSV